MRSEYIVSTEICDECDIPVADVEDMPTTYSDNPLARVDNWRLRPCGHTLSIVRAEPMDLSRGFAERPLVVVSPT